MADGKKVADFLPGPDQLILRQEQTQVTLPLSTEALSYFKGVAEKHHLPYQRVIGKLLDDYVTQQKQGPAPLK
ncbi:MAG: CopG family transcriptional regulator [Gammaproteobacteria bacterium SHHR-1]|uniref:CopG family transcriptional regulator n=1 Tax=Magnetovirga frankeli TaxID=947516 RepID=UPI00327D8A79